MTKPLPRPVRLGIAGLPSEIRALRPGCAYAIVAPDAALRAACIGATLAEALSAKQAAFAVTDLSAAQLFEALARSDIDGARACAQNRLRLFQPEADSLARLQRAGSTQLLDELDHFGIARGSLLIFAPAEMLMPAAEAAALRHVAILRQWLAAAGVVLLALFVRSSARSQTAVGFDGVAELVDDGRHPRWSTHYWRLPDGQVVSPEYALWRTPQGALAVDASIVGGRLDSRVADAADEERVIATEAVVRGEPRVPRLWEIVEDLEALSARAGNAVAATCVLDHDQPHRFRDLARIVRELRRGCGQNLKIVVYEVGVQLNPRQEQLLLALGANVVVLASGVDRLGAIIASLRGQRYGREAAGNFGDALYGLPATRRGYLPPERFCASLIDCARQAAALGLESVLVRLSLRPDIEPLRALHALHMRRAGDLATFAAGNLYLFMFGRWDHDAEQIVDKLFNLPVAELFDGQVRFPTNTAAMAEANTLKLRLRGDPPVDFTELLDAPPPARLADVATARPVIAAPELPAPNVPARRQIVAAPLSLKAAP